MCAYEEEYSVHTLASVWFIRGWWWSYLRATAAASCSHAATITGATWRHWPRFMREGGLLLKEIHIQQMNTVCVRAGRQPTRIHINVFWTLNMLHLTMYLDVYRRCTRCDGAVLRALCLWLRRRILREWGELRFYLILLQLQESSDQH